MAKQTKELLKPYWKHFRSPTTKAIHVEEFDTGKSLCGLLKTEGLTPMTTYDLRRAQDYEFCMKCDTLRSFWK